jgi:hypothetical protein
MSDGNQPLQRSMRRRIFSILVISLLVFTIALTLYANVLSSMLKIPEAATNAVTPAQPRATLPASNLISVAYVMFYVVLFDVDL